MNIYHYHHLTGAFLNPGVADDNPREPESPLVAAFATPKQPPDAPDGFVAAYLRGDGSVPNNWQQGEWHVLPDYRAASVYSTQDGSPYPIGVGFTGVGLLPVDATTLPRPSEAHVWSGAAWVSDPIVDARLRKERATRERATRLSMARDAMEPLDIAVELGEATEAEAAQLLAWKRYIVAVNRVDVSATEIRWPEAPTA